MIATHEHGTFDVLKHDLSRFLPIRIVLRKAPDGTLRGLCEESFSMSVNDNRVRIWWSGKAYSMLGEHDINGVEDAAHNAAAGDIILDPLEGDCPVEVDWGRWRIDTSKYGQRNAQFKVREALV